MILARLITNSVALNITIYDLEVRNGKAGSYPLIQSDATTTLNLTRVTLRNMYATDQTGILRTAPTRISTLYLSQVNFINCTTNGSLGIYIKDTVNSYIEDITFSGTSASTFIKIECSSVNTTVTFGGNISLSSDGNNTTQGALLLLTSTNAYDVRVLSNPYNPAKWYFQDLAQNGINVLAPTGVVLFLCLLCELYHPDDSIHSYLCHLRLWK